ncbi:MAG: hypothetical protein LBU79_02230 [Planctomycetota bacterium]|jgi:vacuolar-type H+-ATPase subunit E/Vma4|nr:hypothetical protein [Planctomycetota bacterium]
MSVEAVRDKVLAAARAKAGELAAAADREAESIALEAKTAAERRAADLVRETRLRLERETQREVERLQYENRLAILAAKNKAIAEVFRRVEASIAKLPEDDYVGRVADWLSALPPEAGGVLRVNPADAGKFTPRLDRLNKGRKGAGRFTAVQGDPVVVNGAILDGTDFSVDCTFGRRLESLRESALADLAKELFAAG